MDKLLLVLPLLLPGALCDLPVYFSVISYDLGLNVTSNLNADVQGTVIIALTCRKPTTAITMNWGSSLTPSVPSASNFLIYYFDTLDSAGTPVKVNEPEMNGTINQLTITAADPDTGFKEGGIYTIQTKFSMKLNTDNKGLFYRNYSIENNQIDTVLLTNLWPVFARELFPCLDEPLFPASLNLSLTYPDSWNVAATGEARHNISGSPVGTITTLFTNITTTPSNFAFFLATNMRQMNYSVTRSTTRLSFWGRKSLQSSKFSANVQFLAEYYYLVEDTIGITLPLKQLTVVMVPGLEEPYAGYGMIFIREDNYAQDYTSSQMEGLFKTNVAPIIYQFLRQFSEFSTRPNSWSDYWVSQAIAKYLQFLVLNTVLPILDFKTDLEVVARQTALSLDSQVDAKPLYDTTINTNFTSSIQALVNDPLKSLKGATILNMLDTSLPAGTTFAVITSFLAKNNNTSVTSDQFLTAIQSVQDSTVLSPFAKLALNSTLGYWFNNTQYPLETVKVNNYTSQGSSGVVNFTTTAFCSIFKPSCKLPGAFYVSATVGSKTDNRYYTPRNDLWVTNSVPDSTVNTTIDVQENDWVVANMKSGGYYRSTYDEKNWERIISAFSSGDQHLLGRTQLLDDAFALSQANALNYNITIRLALANLGSTMYRDWVPVRRGLRALRDNLLGLVVYNNYKDFATGYFLNFDRFLQNSSTDAFEKVRIQTLFLDELCEYDISGYRSSAVGNLTGLIKGTLPNTVPSSAYDALACCGGRYSSNLKAQTLWDILTNSTLNYYSRRFASVALGCLSNYSDVSQFLKPMSIADKQLKPYMKIVLENVAENNPDRFLANFTQLTDQFQSQLGTATVAYLIMQAGRKINNNTYSAVLDDLSKDSTVDPVLEMAAQNTKAAISYRVSWLSNYNQTLASALQSHTLPSGTSSAINLSVTPILIFIPFFLFIMVPMSV